MAIDEGDLTIQRTSTADQVADSLRRRILKGELRPGTPLREAALATSLGVSRNTVREGVRVLVSEGLLTRNVHRGVVVTALTPQDVRDVYHVRKVVETAAVLRVDLRAGGLLEEMRATLEDLTVGSDDLAAIVDLDLRFHRLSVDAIGSPRLSAFYANTLAELRLALFEVNRADLDWREWVDDHAGILEALQAGRRGDCVKLLETHLDGACERLIRTTAVRADGVD